MNIYKLKKTYSFAELIPCSDFADISYNGFIGVSMKKEWKPFMMEWNFEIFSIKPDISMLGGILPVINNRVKKSLLLIGLDDLVEFLPVIVDNEEYYVINVLYHTEGLLSTRKSKINYSSNKRIIYIDEYVFYKEETKPIFKVSQLLTHIFVNDIFKDVIEKHSFTGLEFEKCKVIKRNWFN